MKCLCNHSENSNEQERANQNWKNSRKSTSKLEEFHSFVSELCKSNRMNASTTWKFSQNYTSFQASAIWKNLNITRRVNPWLLQLHTVTHLLYDLFWSRKFPLAKQQNVWNFGPKVVGNETKSVRQLNVRIKTSELHVLQVMYHRPNYAQMSSFYFQQMS